MEESETMINTGEHHSPNSSPNKQNDIVETHVDNLVLKPEEVEECTNSNVEKICVPDVNQLNVILQQKENIIKLLEREKLILEKEKHSLKMQSDSAVKEKENAVIRFAIKEKDLIDAKKDKDNLLKQLNESKKEIKNITARYHVGNEEKGRLSSMLDEKCNEVKRYVKENEKLKTDVCNLEMKLKWSTIKLNQEVEVKQTLEKQIEELSEKGQKPSTKETDQHRIEKEANLILLKHENEGKDKIIEDLRKQQRELEEKVSKLQDSLNKELNSNNNLQEELKHLQEEHNFVQNSLSEEILNAAKLRSELEANRILKAHQIINEEKLKEFEILLEEKEKQIADSDAEIIHLRSKETELLGINKEMSEMIVNLQNEIYLQNSKIKAIEAEKTLLLKEKLEFDTNIGLIEAKLNEEIKKRNEERLVLTKHLSEKTKLYENTKAKLENSLGDLEVTKKKHSQVIKELHREINKYRKQCTEVVESTRKVSETSDSQSDASLHIDNQIENCAIVSESRMVKEPSKEHLVERILRLQQAGVRQTEKIDFLENHTMSLVAELQRKSKIIQYYMIRDQAGALTSSKSDQNKTELAKYGGVMSAIYTGIKGSNQSMTLDLSLEINKKLQAVLEDTLLKNITLKENLDMLGLEVDKLTRQLAKVGNKYKGSED